MTCLPSRPSQSTPNPQIHRFFITNSFFFLYLYYQWPWRKSPAAFHTVQLKLLCSGPGDGKARMSGQALNILTGCSSHTAAGRSRCRKYTWGLWRNPWSSCETRTSCCHGTLGTGWRRSRRRSGTSGDAEPSKETQRGSIHTVVFYRPKDLIIWEKPPRFQFGRRIW